MKMCYWTIIFAYCFQCFEKKSNIIATIFAKELFCVCVYICVYICVCVCVCVCVCIYIYIYINPGVAMSCTYS